MLSACTKNVLREKKIGYNFTGKYGEKRRNRDLYDLYTDAVIFGMRYVKKNLDYRDMQLALHTTAKAEAIKHFHSQISLDQRRKTFLRHDISSFFFFLK